MLFSQLAVPKDNDFGIPDVLHVSLSLASDSALDTLGLRRDSACVHIHPQHNIDFISQKLVPNPNPTRKAPWRRVCLLSAEIPEKSRIFCLAKVSATSPHCRPIAQNPFLESSHMITASASSAAIRAGSHD